MSFPHDLRIDTYAVNAPLPSATTNALQDGILGIAPAATATVLANGTISRWGTVRADWICDGVADDVQIQAAIDWVNAQGGGTVLLSRGTFYLAANIDLKSSVRLLGQGRQGTILKIPNAIATSFAMLHLSDCNDVTIAALTLDGNAAGIGAFEHDGIYVEGGAFKNQFFFDLAVRNMNWTATRGNGIRLSSGQRCNILACQIQDCEGSGIEIDSGYGYCQINGCFLYASSAKLGGTYVDVHGLQVEEAPCIITGSYSKWVGGYVTGSPIAGGGWGISFSSATQWMLIGVRISNNDGHGISTNNGCNDITIRECEVHTNGQDTDDTYSGIVVSGSTRVTIADNIIHHGGGAKQHKYGIYINGAATSLMVFGNDLRAAGKTADLIDATASVHTWPAYTWDGAAHNLDDWVRGNFH